MLLVSFRGKEVFDKDGNGHIEYDTNTAQVYGTCADDYDTAVVALIHAIAEEGDDTCVVAYERAEDMGYTTNIEAYEGVSYAALMVEWDPIRLRHVWWNEDEVPEKIQLW